MNETGPANPPSAGDYRAIRVSTVLVTLRFLHRALVTQGQDGDVTLM